MRASGLLLAAALVGSFASACDPAPYPEVAVLGLPIINGETDTSPEHMGVVYIQGDLGGGYVFACTGTLISPDVVLTASHCVCRDRSTVALSAASLTVGFGDRCSMFSCPLTWRSVAEVRRHPNYNSDYVLNDIALLRLSEPAPAGVRPIPSLPEHLAITSDDVGAPIEFVGFGQTETGSVGVKMRFVGAVHWICPGPDYCQHSYGVYGMPKTLCFDQGLGGTCQGDSGGPALFERAGIVYVAAVTSYGDPQGCSLYGCSTKVDAFQEFITDFTGGGLGLTCASDQDCFIGHCVQGVCCESTCETACMSCAEPGRAGRCVLASNGSSCADGDVCNGDEICLLGECVAGAPLQCADSNPCIQDACHPSLGCLNETEPDGFPCGDCQMCLAGACVAADCGSGGCASAVRPAPDRTGPWLLVGLFGLLALAIRRTSK